MSFQHVAGPPRRDPLFLAICIFTLLIAEIALRVAFGGAQMMSLQPAGGGMPASWQVLLLGPLFGGLFAYFLGRQLGLALGGVFFAAGTAWLLAAPQAIGALALFGLGHGLLVTCLLAIAAAWLPNDRGNSRLALFFGIFLAGQAAFLVVPMVGQTGGQGKLLVGAFAALLLMCGLGLAALDFWAGRGSDPPRGAEKAPSRSQLEALGLLAATGILAHGALFCAYQQETRALTAWLANGMDLAWLPGLGTILAAALLLVGLLLALMGTFMGLPRLGVAASIPFALAMAAIAVLCGTFLHGEGEPMLAFNLFSALGTGFLQMALVPLLSAIAGGVRPRFAPLALGVYLGLGGPLLGHLIGGAAANAGNAGVYTFAVLLIAAATLGHFLGRHADAALKSEEPAAAPPASPKPESPENLSDPYSP